MQIFNDDCLSVLKNLEESSVDIIFTSPPYNLGGNHHTGSKKTQAYSDDLPEEDYQKWQISILNECYRILSPKGSLIYNHKNRIKKGVQISPYEWLFKTQFIVKQELIWINGSQNFDKIRFYPFTERLYWLSKDPSVNLDNVIGATDVFKWNSEGSNLAHTRTFPKAMVMDILSCFPEAKLVLDPFMGLGTVGVIAKELGKDFIGIEINKEHFEYAEKRLSGKFPETNKNKIIEVRCLF